MRLVGGLIIGLLLGLGGTLGWQQLSAGDDPCRGRCGAGTRCEQGRCLVAPPAAKVAKGRRRRHRRRGRRRRARSTSAEESLRTPSARDLRPQSRGPSLKGTDYVDLQHGGAGEQRELSSQEVTARFRRQDRRIVACIDQARQGWDVRSGRVVVGFRIERSGSVSRVRVSAPALLLQKGLHGCITPLVKALHFPASARALVMSFPFSLH